MGNTAYNVTFKLKVLQNAKADGDRNTNEIFYVGESCMRLKKTETKL